MKKLEPSNYLDDHFGPIRITRDDVDFLIALFRRDVAPPVLSDNHFEFDSLDDFIEHKGITPKELEIESKTEEPPYRYIKVVINGNIVLLSGTRDAPFHEAKELFSSKNKWLYKILSPYPWVLLAMIAISLFTSIESREAQLHKSTSLWSLYLSAGSLLVAIAFFAYRYSYFGLRLRRSHEGGFWKRNAERIIMTLIGAIIGALATWLAKSLGN